MRFSAISREIPIGEHIQAENTKYMYVHVYVCLTVKELSNINVVR